VSGGWGGGGCVKLSYHMNPKYNGVFSANSLCSNNPQRHLQLIQQSYVSESTAHDKVY